MTGTEITPARLSEIASTVNEEHAKIESALQDSLQRAVSVGSLLLEAKELVKHGSWLTWLSENCAFSERTAQQYMRCSARAPELTKSATVADLTYSEAIGLLTAPQESAPQEQAAPAAWWWALETHELGNLFPIDNGVIDVLTFSMQKNGFDDYCPPIILFEGKVLDGKLRLAACKRAGVTPRFEYHNGDFESAKNLVITRNGLRANYSETQKAGIMERLKSLDAELLGTSDIKHLVRIAKEAGTIQNRLTEFKVTELYKMGKALNQVQSLTNTSTLKDAERVIEKHIAQAQEIARALIEIRDKHLYRDKSATFEAYCLQEHNLSGEQIGLYLEALDWKAPSLTQ